MAEDKSGARWTHEVGDLEAKVERDRVAVGGCFRATVGEPLHGLQAELEQAGAAEA